MIRLLAYWTFWCLPSGFILGYLTTPLYSSGNGFAAIALLIALAIFNGVMTPKVQT